MKDTKTELLLVLEELQELKIHLISLSELEDRISVLERAASYVRGIAVTISIATPAICYLAFEFYKLIK